MEAKMLYQEMATLRLANSDARSQNMDYRTLLETAFWVIYPFHLISLAIIEFLFIFF